LLTHHLKEEEEELFAEGRKILVTQGRKSYRSVFAEKQEALKEDFLVKETPMEAELQND